MKSKLIVPKQKNKPDIKCPILMEYVDKGPKKCVVLFLTKGTGIQMTEGSCLTIGQYRENLISIDDTDVWRPFEGTVELSNDDYN
jgi:hypothetical protein